MNGKRPLSINEYESIHCYLKARHRYRDLAMISMCFHTGYRIKEVLSVRVKDVFTASGEFKEKLYIAPRRMKRGTPRMPIPLRDQLKDDLALLRYELKTNDLFYPGRYLIQSQKGKNKAISYTQAYRIIKDLFDAKDIEDNVAVHSFRKSFAMDVYKKSGKDIRKTQEIMGHTTLATTIKYLPVSQEELCGIILT